MAVKSVPDGYHTVTPYLLVSGVYHVMEFLKHAFGAKINHQTRLPNGAVMHAEMQIGDSRLMIGEVPQGHDPMPAGIYLYVPNMDTLYARAIQAGGTSLSAPSNQFYGDRVAGVKDPGGNTWWIATHIEDVSAEEIARRDRHRRA